MLSFTESFAVLKEKDLEQTLRVLRSELTEYHQELTSQADERKEQTRSIIIQLHETMKRSNQNSLMLYSQRPNYVFDLTYACHEATEQYADFQRQQLPFASFLVDTDDEIAKYDSLVNSLKAMRPTMLSFQAQTDRTVCLTLSTNIKNTLEENRAQVAEYINLYEMTEQRLKNLNDYANKRYTDIQTNIFMNGGESYFSILRHFHKKLIEANATVNEKYKPSHQKSDWDSTVILRLFLM